MRSKRQGPAVSAPYSVSSKVLSRKYRVHNEPSRVEQRRHLVEIIALVGAAFWAVYVFVYQERLKPASEAPDLQQSLALHHEMVSGGNEFVKVDFDIKNIGHVPAMLDGLVVNAGGRIGRQLVTFRAIDSKRAPVALRHAIFAYLAFAVACALGCVSARNCPQVIGQIERFHSMAARATRCD